MDFVKIKIDGAGYGSPILAILNRYRGEGFINNAIISSYEINSIEHYKFLKNKFKKDEIYTPLSPNLTLFATQDFKNVIKKTLKEKYESFVSCVQINDSLEFMGQYKTLLKRYYIYEWIGNVNCYGFSYHKPFKFCVGFDKKHYDKTIIDDLRIIMRGYKTRNTKSLTPLTGIKSKDILNSAKRLGYPPRYFVGSELNYNDIFRDISNHLPPDVYNIILTNICQMLVIHKKDNYNEI